MTSIPHDLAGLARAAGLVIQRCVAAYHRDEFFSIARIEADSIILYESQDEDKLRAFVLGWIASRVQS